MITTLELLHGHNLAELTWDQEKNLEELRKRINVIRDAWSRPMIVTSGFRNTLDQERINPKVKDSAHCKGCAVDIADDGQLMHWLKNDSIGITTLEKAQLWCEDGTVGWVHFQTYPPKSGHRFFKP